MDTVLMELGDIQTALAGNIGILLVLADGLDGYTRSMALSGADAEAYVNALSRAYDALAGITREFGETLDRARGEREPGAGG